MKRWLLVLAGCAAVISGFTMAKAEDARGKLLQEPILSGTLSPQQIDAHAAKAGYAEVTGKARCGVQVYGLNYRTPDIWDKPSNSSAALLVPTGAGCDGPAPLLVYARGTELQANYDMSKLDNEGTLRLAEAFASQGYVVVASDYLGYVKSASAYHPYFSKKITSSIIDSYTAAINAQAKLKFGLSGKTFFSGHSQGGYNIVATVEEIEKQHLAIPVDGIVPQSGISRPSVLYRSQAFGKQQGLPNFLLSWSMSIWHIQTGAGLTSPEAVFKQPYARQVSHYLTPQPRPNLLPLTLEAIMAPPQKIYQDSFWDDFLHNDNNPVAQQAFANDIIGWNSPHRWTFCTGKNEGVVKPQLFWQPLVKEMQAAGSKAVAIADVDGIIKAKFYPVPRKYSMEYHAPGTVVACSVLARQFFDSLK